MFAFKSFLFENMLTEDKIDFISDKQGPKAWEAYEKDKGTGKPKVKDAKAIIKTLSTWSEKNLQWLVNAYIKGQYSLEDKGRIIGVVNDFEKYKKKLEKKDLNQYKTVDEVEKALENFTENDAKSNNQLNKEATEKFFKDKEAKLFFEGGGVKVIIPKTEAASCHFGIGTKWCTAAKNNNQFSNYAKSGTLYIVYLGDGRKYQFYFRSKSQQMMDEQDRPVRDWHEIVKKYPAMYDAFESIAKRIGFLPLIKEPTAAEIIKAMKNDLDTVVEDFSKANKILPKEAADYAISTRDHLLSSYPKAFDKNDSIEYLKSRKTTPYTIVGWLTNMIGKVKKEDLINIIDSLVKNRDRSTLGTVINGIFKDHKLATAYAKFIRDLPEEELLKIVAIDSDLLDKFEDELSEKSKIEIIDKDPDLLKNFEKATNKMKQAAQWAHDRIKRKSRGF